MRARRVPARRQIDERPPSEELRLEPEQEREPEHLPAPRVNGPGGTVRADRSRAAFGGHRQGDAGEQEEHRSAEPVDEHGHEETVVVTVGLARPGVGDMGGNHDHHRDAARGIEVGLAIGQGWTS